MMGIFHLFILCQSTITTTAERRLDRFYQRYQQYPPYCSNPEEMATRSIPPLPNDHIRHLQVKNGATDSSATNSNTNESSGRTTASSNPSSRLVHVTAIIRHGARTPTHPHLCWDGYWDGSEGIWDCQLKTVLSTRPYSYPNNGTDENNNNNVDKAFYLVEKVYDAFQGDAVDSPYKNNLNGTCQAGQLIQQGYEQQQVNGQLLRAAYVYDGKNSNDKPQDPRLRLFDTSSPLPPEVWPFSPENLRFRSDDDQRTLASGQILLSTMFQPELTSYKTFTGSNPIIPHHTADRPLDILSPKFECTSSQQATQDAMASQEFQEYVKSQESQTMQQMLQKELGIAPHANIMDCMMTAICTDRTLPKVLDDFGEEDDDNSEFTKLYGARRFERLMNYYIRNETIVNRFNDAKWSKLVMAPLWAEILDHILPVIQGNNDEHGLKFAFYSAHDSTIARLMASLSPRLWNITDFPWYASMMIIEIHEILSDSPDAASPDYAFRLVYNGQALTWLVDGCPEFSHLCDVSILIDRVSQFATRKNGGCGDGETRSDTTSSSDEGPASKRKIHLLLSAEETIIDHPITFLIVSMVTSFVIGSLLTCCVIRCCWRRPRRRQRNQSELVLGTEETSSDFMAEEPDVVID